MSGMCVALYEQYIYIIDDSSVSLSGCPSSIFVQQNKVQVSENSTKNIVWSTIYVKEQKRTERQNKKKQSTVLLFNKLYNLFCMGFSNLIHLT